MIDLRTATAVDAVSALRSGAISSRELLTALVERVERLNPSINAVVATDIERAVEEARAADDAFVRTGPTGPLHGLPMTVKDAFETVGVRTTSGASELRDHVPAHDAVAVARLRAAGAIVFGKTNLPRYAADWQTTNDLHGTTNNPWALDRVPGGSSGGSAAALASGMSPLELGSDIGGSIRVPAGFCGVYGHKPTYGAVSVRGHIPGQPGAVATPDLGVVGPMGRSVDDLELGLAALVAGGLDDAPGALPAAPAHVLRRPRVVVHLDDPVCPIDADVRAVLESAATALQRAGAVVVEAPVPPLSHSHPVYGHLLTAAMSDARALEFARRVLTEHRADDDAGHRYAADVAMPHIDWKRLDEERHRIRAAWADDVFSVADVVLAPISPLPAFHHIVGGHWSDRTLVVDGVQRNYSDVMLPWPGLATLPGLPATAVPVGLTGAGLPVGVQLVGARWADHTCLAVAQLLEHAVGGFTPPPTS